MNTEREAFEKWHKSKYNGINYKWDDVHGYINLRTHLDYVIWQAASAALQKRIEELEDIAVTSKNEALEQAAQIAQDESRMLRKHFKAKYGDVSSSELIRALKAGDVQAPKEGWKLVPIEPTKEMLEAGGKQVNLMWHSLRDEYKAMIAAAPTDTEGK